MSQAASPMNMGEAAFQTVCTRYDGYSALFELL